MEKEQAEKIEYEQNVYVDIETDQYNVGGGYDSETGWMPIPEDWKK